MATLERYFLPGRVRKRDPSKSTLPLNYNSRGAESFGASDNKFGWEEDENKDRGNWSGKMDFLLSAIGFAVGLGNVWRFPYLCFRNGGGAFLIPYAICLALAGLPLFYFELALGQFSSLSPIKIWVVSPIFKGVGYAMVTISGLVCIYYNVIICYVIFYFFASLTSELPWSHCRNDWNTIFCKDRYGMTKTGNDTSMYTNETQFKDPADEYWNIFVLDRSPGIDMPGNIRWQLALCLLLAWVVVFICLSKGIKSTGKVVYFTALFPYVVLTILLIRGATLPGAYDGIYFYMYPKVEKLADAKVWGDAAVQIFYSLGPAWGGLITMASYNRFHNNCYRDAIIVAIVNCATSVFAGFAIFSVIGFMAFKLGSEIENVVDSGPGLAFIAYPAGISMMPVAPLWSVLFFFMLFTLGLDSMFTMFETVVSAFCDEFPNKLRGRKTILTLILCIVGFLIGLPQVTQGGVYWMNLMDWYSAGFPLFIVSLFELCIIMFIYGYPRFADDIYCMLGFYPNPYWVLTWNFITPILLALLILFNGIQYVPVYYGDYKYPTWAEALGWLMAMASIVWIPIFMVVEIISQAKKGTISLRNLFCPRLEWGPALNTHRSERGSVLLDQEGRPITQLASVNATYPYSNTTGYPDEKKDSVPYSSNGVVDAPPAYPYPDNEVTTKPGGLANPGFQSDDNYKTAL